MDTNLTAILEQLPLHVILMLGIIALWRENRRLVGKLETIADHQQEQTDMLTKQNIEISAIKAQTNGKH